MNRRFTIIFFCILLICSIFFRTYKYKNISIDYDEYVTIDTQLENTTAESIYNYLFLQNLIKYNEVDQIENGIAWSINICFPLFYTILKSASLLSHEIDFFRLIVIIIGIITIVLLFLVGKKYSLQTGIIASALLLFHPWAQHHSTYIRFYGFWTFISILCLWYVEFVITKIKQDHTTPFHFFLLAICILLPCSIHAFGVISSLFLLCILISHFYYHRTDFTKISLANKNIFGITFILLTIIVCTNVLVFAYAVFIRISSHVMNEAAYNSESTVHAFTSILFNFGYFYPFIIGLLILLMILNKSYKYQTLNRYLFSTTVSLIPISLLIIANPRNFRPDYIYGILPYILLLIALSIEQIAQELCKIKYKVIFSIAMALFLIVSTLPTFISNVFIDNDRFDFIEAAKFISRIEQANFYSGSPGYFNIYLNEPKVQQIWDINPENHHSQKDEYFFVRMRKGKSTKFFYDFKKLKNAQLIKIIGKDRLDLRENKIYIFFRKKF